MISFTIKFVCGCLSKVWTADGKVHRAFSCCKPCERIGKRDMTGKVVERIREHE